MSSLVNQNLPQHTTSPSGSGEEEEEEEELGTNMAAPVGAPFLYITPYFPFSSIDINNKTSMTDTFRRLIDGNPIRSLI